MHHGGASDSRSGSMQQRSIQEHGQEGATPRSQMRHRRISTKDSQRRKVWNLVTMNSTSCATGKSWLKNEAVKQADIVAWQEIHVTHHEADLLRDHLRSHSWHAVIEPSLSTEAGGLSGGVGILTAKQLGQQPPSFLPTCIVETGRILVRHVQGIIKASFQAAFWP